MTLPKKLAIFFGFPSLVNGVTTIGNAVNVFKKYDLVVFGEGLELNTHSDHDNVISIINHPQMTGKIFGYVDSTRTTTDFQNRVNLLEAMGFDGVYADKFGYDSGTTREKQNEILDYIHSIDLLAFVNAYNSDDVFSNTVDLVNNPLGTASNISTSDWYLASSYQIAYGEYQTETEWKIRSDKMADYKQTFGTNMAVTTTYDSRAFEQIKMDYAYYSTVLYGFDAFGWSEEFYSASSSALPFRARKVFYGNMYKSAITEDSGVYERETNVGIKLDTVNHTVDILTS